MGEATRSDETTRARIVWCGGAAEEGKEKIEKTFWCTLRVCFAPSGLLRAVDGENAAFAYDAAARLLTVDLAPGDHALRVVWD